MTKNKNKLYIETYGCQMNISDSEIVSSILTNIGYEITTIIEEASLILFNTCSVRENAENKVFQRLNVIKKLKRIDKTLLIGVIGCMAERLQYQLLEEKISVDIVAGPDSYKTLPELIEIAKISRKAINIHLSETETYSDINPMRSGSNQLSAFVSIMRGCNNFCSYCIVPYTRGRERSRDFKSILKEVKLLSKNGYKEINLLGQNVNSYNIKDSSGDISFSELIKMIAEIDGNLRIRFTTSHPKDISEDLVKTIASYDNICKSIHLPFQSGSNKILKKMNRGYSREGYIEKINMIRHYIPDCGITTDILCGFCDETEEDHYDTLSLMEYVIYDMAYMFRYSNRPGTYAEKQFIDNVPEDVKITRLNEIINTQHRHSKISNSKDLNKIFEVLVEGKSKKNENMFFGRSSQNKVIVFDKKNVKSSDFVKVKINSYTTTTLIGEICD